MRETSIGAALRTLTARFRDAGLGTPALDARLLVMHATGLRLEVLVTAPERPLRPADAEVLEALAGRRLQGEPVARLLGRREFWGLDFDLSPSVLVPRPDTESLVEAALAWADRRGPGDAPLRIADLGTGSGCLLAALLVELPGAWGLGVDLSLEACCTARGNLARHGLLARAAVVRGDWMAALALGFDLVVSNPPYVRRAALGALAPEVARFDPQLALDGGPDGLVAYRALIPQAAHRLRPGGLLALEVGQGQSEAVTRLAEAAGLTVADVRSDLAGVPRVVAAVQS